MNLDKSSLQALQCNGLCKLIFLSVSETVSKSLSNPNTGEEHPKAQAGEVHHYSVDEMASALLDDTTDEMLQPRMEGGISHFSKLDYKTEPNLARYLYPKSHPSLPELPFSGDGTLALGITSDGTAISNASWTYFSGRIEETSATSPSAPAIPRKSSKRKSIRPNSTHKKIPLSNGDEMEPNIESGLQGPKHHMHAQSSETARAGATAPLKRESGKTLSNGTDKVLLQGPYLPPKAGFKEGKVFMKIQTTIKKFQPRKTRTRRCSTPEEILLDPSNNELQEWEEEEPRSDEGKVSVHS